MRMKQDPLPILRDLVVELRRAGRNGEARRFEDIVACPGSTGTEALARTRVALIEEENGINCLPEEAQKQARGLLRQIEAVLKSSGVELL